MILASDRSAAPDPCPADPQAFNLQSATLESALPLVCARLEALVAAHNDRLILAGIFGMPNAGKSLLINAVADFFAESGRQIARSGGAPSRSLFESIRDGRPFESPLLFHYGDLRCPSTEGFPAGAGEDNPARLARRILGRGLDFKVAIYNPELHHAVPDPADYDIVICNAASFAKDRLEPPA